MIKEVYIKHTSKKKSALKKMLQNLKIKRKSKGVDFKDVP